MPDSRRAAPAGRYLGRQRLAPISVHTAPHHFSAIDDHLERAGKSCHIGGRRSGGQGAWSPPSLQVNRQQAASNRLQATSKQLRRRHMDIRRKSVPVARETSPWRTYCRRCWRWPTHRRPNRASARHRSPLPAPCRQTYVTSRSRCPLPRAASACCLTQATRTVGAVARAWRVPPRPSPS